MKELYKLPARPEANRQNILQGDKYRITMLTEGLVRLVIIFVSFIRL